MTAVYVPWQYDRSGDFTRRDHDATEASFRNTLHDVKELAYRGDIHGRSYREAVRAYKEARTRLYAIREHLPPALLTHYPEMPLDCAEP